MIRNGLQVNRFIISLCLATAASISIYGQTTPPPKTPKKPVTRIEAPAYPSPREAPQPSSTVRGTSEKALAVEAKVHIQLPCISRAKVVINGWERNEIRVFVKNGSKFAVRVHEKDASSGKPNWVLVTILAPDRSRIRMSDCISGDRVEIDVPMKASVEMKAFETETRIDSVRKVNIKNVGGNVALRNISGGITAATYEGDVAVENSGGQISLETSTGNVIAYGVSPGEIGDTFTTKTRSGTITLQKVDHRQIDANSVSGSVIFNGKFLPGGLYNFTTSDGSVKLAIPSDSSCRIIASYGFGKFDTVFPLKIETENITEGGQSMVAKMGAGGADVRVTTSSGSVNITKQQ